MSLLTLQNAQLAFGHVALLDHADFSLEASQRVGLIGRNGAGKSSLLKILGGLQSMDDGLLQVQKGLRIAYVAQEPLLDESLLVFDAVSAGLASLRQAIEDYAEGDTCGPTLDALTSRIESLGGWNWQQRVDEIIHRLHLQPKARVGELSGGTQKRVALAQALVTQPDVLLLDEPTNHLDMDAILRLERLLIDFTGSLLVITHDRAFLDAVSTRIVALDRGRLWNYPGNFSQYVTRRAEQLEQERVVNAKTDKLLAQEETWIRRGVEARRTRARGRIHRLENLRMHRAARREALGQVKMAVAGAMPSGKIVAELTDVSFAWPSATTGVPQSGDAPSSPAWLIKDLSTTLLRGDKVGLIAPNGAGKTTLLKLILGELAPSQGKVRLGSKLSVAYFDQMRSSLDLDAPLVEFISPGSEWIEWGEGRKHVRSYLTDFLFDPARADSPVRSLSGGERNRLLLARLFASPANVLVLDEPTNDLDIDTLELLEALLQDYKGTVFLVSHDRAFLNNVVTTTLVCERDASPGRWREFVGDVSDWLVQHERSRQLATQLARQNEGPKPPDTPKVAASTLETAKGESPPQGEPPPKKRKLSYKDQRELDGLPAQLAALEAAQKGIREQLAEGSIYQTDYAAALHLLAQDAQIEESLMALLTRWEALGGGS